MTIHSSCPFYWIFVGGLHHNCHWSLAVYVVWTDFVPRITFCFARKSSRMNVWLSSKIFGLVVCRIRYASGCDCRKTWLGKVDFLRILNSCLLRLAPYPLMITNNFRRETRMRGLFLSHLIFCKPERLQVKIRRKWLYTGFGKVFEPRFVSGPSILIIVEVWAVVLRTFVCFLAWLCLEKLWMVLLFFPTVWKGAIVHIQTSLIVGKNLILCRPRFAHPVWVRVHLWFSAIVLPVMCIDASLSVMIWIFVTVRTPHCLEMKQVKVHVDV